MQKINSLILVAISGFAIYLSALTANKLLCVFSAIISIVSLGFFFKSFAYLLPRCIRDYVVVIHVILLELAGLILIYLMSFFSVFFKRLNKNVRKTPILLVHGYINFSSVWFFHAMRLKRKGYGPIFLINLGFPFFGIETYAKKIKTKITEIQKTTKNNKVVIIGHSMGGLVSSYYAEKYPDHADIKAVITLGSPLKGTKVAKIGIGKCCRQMEAKSSFIQKAQKKYPVEVMYHIVTKKDQLIIPYTSGVINQKKGRSYVIDNLGHASLLYSTRVFKKIDQWLKEVS